VKYSDDLFRGRPVHPNPIFADSPEPFPQIMASDEGNEDQQEANQQGNHGEDPLGFHSLPARLSRIDGLAIEFIGRPASRSELGRRNWRSSGGTSCSAMQGARPSRV
jgi:proteasome lid subunit RPN8/RPN11